MITYFSLEWKNWSCHPGNEVSSTILIISGSKRKITYGELDGRGNILSQQDGPLQAASAREFFLLVEDIAAQWGECTDFSVPVCDGSCWQIKVRHNTGKSFKYKGTIHYPPQGVIIEEALKCLCQEADLCVSHYFGCSI